MEVSEMIIDIIIDYLQVFRKYPYSFSDNFKITILKLILKNWKKLMLRLFPKKWFKCANCGGIWMKEWSDEECAKEYKENFPNDPNREWPIELICSDCYKEFKPWLDDLTPGERKEIEKGNIIKTDYVDAIGFSWDSDYEFDEELEKLTEKFTERLQYRLTIPKEDDNLK
jgi:hypothetical protein